MANACNLVRKNFQKRFGKKKFAGIPESQKNFKNIFAKKNFKYFQNRKKNLHKFRNRKKVF